MMSLAFVTKTTIYNESLNPLKPSSNRNFVDCIIKNKKSYYIYY